MTVAIPVRDGGGRFEQVLAALRTQVTRRSVELIVCDSGSSDGSADAARAAGATLLRIEPREFSHGGTRNLLMERSSGGHVVFLTQDAVPAGDLWLEALLAGFDVADDVGLVFGPYRPLAGASPMVCRELSEWFASLQLEGQPRIDRLDPGERALPVGALLGPRGFFTDANGAIARAAWKRVPFRHVPYAEDQQLAIDMLRAGYAKVFAADAAVEHSHEYSPWRKLRRCFDEWRALREVYGFVEPLSATTLRDRVLAPARADVRWARARGAAHSELGSLAVRAVLHHAARTAGAALGSRHHRLPERACRRLSLESRATFRPVDRENGHGDATI